MARSAMRGWRFGITVILLTFVSSSCRFLIKFWVKSKAFVIGGLLLRRHIAYICRRKSKKQEVKNMTLRFFCYGFAIAMTYLSVNFLKFRNDLRVGKYDETICGSGLEVLCNWIRK